MARWMRFNLISSEFRAEPISAMRRPIRISAEFGMSRGSRKCSQRRRSGWKWHSLAVDRLFGIARLDEAALRFERGHVGAGKLLGDFGQCLAPGGERFDQPLVDADILAIALFPI